MTQALSGHGCFQWYLHRMGRAPSPHCMHCTCGSDTAGHTIFHCVNWEGCRSELRELLGRSLVAVDMPNILCGPVLEELPMDHRERAVVLNETEESFRIFYKMVEDILTLKDIEERARQAADNVANGCTSARDTRVTGSSRLLKRSASARVLQDGWLPPVREKDLTCRQIATH